MGNNSLKSEGQRRPTMSKKKQRKRSHLLRTKKKGRKKPGVLSKTSPRFPRKAYSISIVSLSHKGGFWQKIGSTKSSFPLRVIKAQSSLFQTHWRANLCLQFPPPPRSPSARLISLFDWRSDWVFGFPPNPICQGWFWVSDWCRR